jgi:hypothetical protein
MKIAIAIANSNYQHLGIRRRISTTADALRKRHNSVDIFPLNSKFLGSNIGWFANEYPFVPADYDVVILRSILLGRKMKNSFRVAHTFSERHYSIHHPESFKDLMRVKWEHRILNPINEGTGILYVTSEIARMDNSNKPNFIVGNPSLDVGLFDLSRRPMKHRVGMSVGSLAAWSGIDVFFKLAGLKHDFTFVLVMPKDLRIPLGFSRGLTKNVQIVRVASYSEYVNELLSWSHAVGPLALERKGLTEAAPLKVRDYISLGIPTFIRYFDTNLSRCDDDALKQVSWEDQLWSDSFLGWLTQTSDGEILQLTKDCIDPMKVEGSKMNFIEKTINNFEN